MRAAYTHCAIYTSARAHRRTYAVSLGISYAAGNKLAGSQKLKNGSQNIRDYSNFIKKHWIIKLCSWLTRQKGVYYCIFGSENLEVSSTIEEWFSVFSEVHILKLSVNSHYFPPIGDRKFSAEQNGAFLVSKTLLNRYSSMDERRRRGKYSHGLYSGNLYEPMDGLCISASAPTEYHSWILPRCRHSHHISTMKPNPTAESNNGEQKISLNEPNGDGQTERKASVRGTEEEVERKKITENESAACAKSDVLV